VRPKTNSKICRRLSMYEEEATPNYNELKIKICREILADILKSKMRSFLKHG
jgi:hypothetical protein